MNQFTQIVLTVGRVAPEGVRLLGTGFFVAGDGLVVTTRHVIGNEDRGLCVLAPHIKDLNAFQDTTDTRVYPIAAKVEELDPNRDLAILKIDGRFEGPLPAIGEFDSIDVGEQLAILGFPHATDGRRVLTLQFAELGAKVLLASGSQKVKHAVLNVQARPGQSGSPVISQKRGTVAGVLVGAYGPAGPGISLGGINPRELHQTTHCISASYIKEMLG